MSRRPTYLVYPHITVAVCILFRVMKGYYRFITSLYRLLFCRPRHCTQWQNLTCSFLETSSAADSYLAVWLEAVSVAAEQLNKRFKVLEGNYLHCIFINSSNNLDSIKCNLFSNINIKYLTQIKSKDSHAKKCWFCFLISVQ